MFAIFDDFLKVEHVKAVSKLDKNNQILRGN